MAIQSKKSPTIKKGNGYIYDPNNFEQQPNFFIVGAEDLLKLIHPFEMNGKKYITIDTETHPAYKSSHDVPKGVVRRWVGTGKKAVPQDYPFCISICDGVHSYTVFDSITNEFKEFAKLRPLLEDETVEKIAHNFKFDMHMLANVGLKLKGKLHDTVILAKLINENRPSFRLRDLASHKKGSVIMYEDMVDAYKQINKVSLYTDIPRQLLGQYANADVWNCFLLFQDEFPKLERDSLVDLYDNECELMIALYAMERYGMSISLDYEAPLKAELQKACDEAEQAIYDEAGGAFNINSGKQLYEVLKKLGVDMNLIQMSEKGNPVLDKDALNSLAENHDVSIVKKILEFRKYDKLLNTYAIGIYDQYDKELKVHGSINQTEAATGRMSITKPALQTLPKKDKSIRTMFIPSKGNRLWFEDLDQVEFRLFSHYMKSEAMNESIAKGYDVHAATAAIIYHQPIEEFVKRVEAEEPEAKDMRSKGKTINFALIYGVGQAHLAELLKCTSTEAANVKANYFANIPEAQPFISTVYQVIKNRGFVKNFYGRRRRLSANDCYKAPNALIQGCAADYIKHKIVDIYKFILAHNLKMRMINVVHDEVIFDVPTEEEKYMPVLRWLLSDFTTFRCPITAGIEVADKDWGHKEVPHELGFEEPTDMSFKTLNIFDGKVFDIDKEV